MFSQVFISNKQKKFQSIADRFTRQVQEIEDINMKKNKDYGY